MPANSTEAKSLKLVTFLIDQQRYALHLERVQRVLPMVALISLPDAPAIALGLFNYHGCIIPVLDVRKRFGRVSREPNLNDYLLLASTRQKVVALPVDRVHGVHEVMVEAVIPSGTVLAGIGYVEGLVALSDGILYIHDLDAFLSVEETAHLDQALRGASS